MSLFKKILNKNKGVKANIQNLNLEDKTDYAKFEIWEILTFLTAVFTLASMMVWFSGFYPKHSKDEFLFLDKQKSLVYNEFLQAKNLFNVNLAYLEFESEMTKISELKKSLFAIKNFDEYKENVGQANFYTVQKETILVNLQKEAKFLPQSKILIDATDEYGKYLLNQKNEQEKKYSASQKIINLREAFLALILDGDEKTEENFKIIKRIYDNIRLYNLITNPDFNTKIKEFLASYEQNLEKEASLNSQEVEDFFIYLLGLKTSDLRVKKDFKETSFIAKIKEFEDWQKEFLSTNQNLRENVVWVKV
jgi:hypothetical protein